MGIEVSIVGSGHTRFGRLDEHNLESLIVAATNEALEEAQIEPGDIGEIFLGHFNSGLVSDAFPSSLVHQASTDFRFIPATRYENACASGSAAVFAAVSSIKSGRIQNALVVGVEKMTSQSTLEVTRALSGAAYQNDKDESSLSFPQLFAQVTKKYAERYQCPLEVMAHIAAKNHKNALFNPLAQMQRSLDFDFCNTVSSKNPIIAEPLRLSDCSLITDGAAALVLSNSRHVHSGMKEVVFRANVQVNDFLPLKLRDFINFEGPRKAIADALDLANIKVAQLSFAEVHDCFTIAELLIYEAMGLAPAGEGYRAIKEGVVYRDGDLPINVSGGLKAKGHPIGATGVSMHALAYRQLTGQAGAMQLEAPQFGLVFNMGGTGVANYASILEARRS